MQIVMTRRSIYVRGSSKILQNMPIISISL